MSKPSSRIAYTDISKYLSEKYNAAFNNTDLSKDVITPNKLLTTEQRAMNRELGLSGINKLSDTEYMKRLKEITNIKNLEI